MKVNKPDFGRYISNGLKLDYDGVANLAKITQNISVQMVDRMDDAVIEAIEKAAKEAGITDLFIINKKSVIDALKKQIPKKPSFSPFGYRTEANDIRFVFCSTCQKHFMNDTDIKYCPNCGQAIDWSKDE